MKFKEYPLDKYRFYTHTAADGTREVIAVSSFGGKQVRGVAKCAPQDNYDLEYGKRLAATKCAIKIADRRIARATKCRKKAHDEFEKALNMESKMCQYYEDAVRSKDCYLMKLNELKKG